MEFKNIGQLTITDCCNQLSIPREKLKQVVVTAADDDRLHNAISKEQSWRGVQQEIVQRLETLIREDRQSFLQCKTLQQYETYLSKQEDGLWRDEALKKIRGINAQLEERSFYRKNLSSVEGLQQYLYKYPNGIFSKEAKEALDDKRRNRIVKRVSICITLIIVIFVICYMNYHSASYISSDSNVVFGKKGGSVTCAISTDAIFENVHAYAPEEWITTTIDNGDLTITASPNHDDTKCSTVHLYAYTTLFGINLWRREFEVSVKEDSGLSTFLTVNASSCSFDKYGTGEFECSVETDGMNLEINPLDDWICVKKDVEDEGDVFKIKLLITAKRNETGGKTGVVVVKSDRFEKKISVIQDSGLANSFRVSSNSLVMDEEGTEEGYCYSVDVNTDGTTWSVADAPEWLSAEANIKQGKLQVTLPANEGEIKTGTITIVSNNGHSEDISVKQWGDPTNFSSSSSSVRFGTTGDYKYIEISNNSNKVLSVCEDEDWISTSAISKTRIKITCSQNYESPRGGTVKVRCGDKELEISVNQDGWEECSYCSGNGQVECNNGEAQWRYYLFYNSNYHQVYRVTGQYYSFGVLMPQYGWVNCPTCGGDGKIDCSQCGGKGRKRTSY